MTTAPQTCVCECEECLALRAAEDAPGSGETVASFEHDGSTYEIDHLGIGPGSQGGEYEVYCGDEEVAEFTVAQSVLPVCADELARLARQALSGGTGRDNPPCARPPDPLPARLRPLPQALRPAWRRSHRPPPRRHRPRTMPSAREPGNQHRQLQLIPGSRPAPRTGN
jgi:hypothetical protein